MHRIHHSDFVAADAAIYKPTIYLELGIHAGETRAHRRGKGK